MTIIHRSGDIFTSEMPVIGHGVNMKGQMGAGIAKTVRQKFPSVYQDYRSAIQYGTLTPGSVRLSPALEKPGLWIANISSQIRVGKDAQVPLLRAGLEELVEEMRHADLDGLALPRIGAGIGGLSWESEVLPLIEEIADRNRDFLTVEAWTFAK